MYLIVSIIVLTICIPKCITQLCFKVFGTDGMALAENPRESSTVIDRHDGGRTRRLYNSFPQRFKGPFEAELDHFVRCLDGNLRFINACYVSIGNIPQINKCATYI